MGGKILSVQGAAVLTDVDKKEEEEEHSGVEAGFTSPKVMRA